MTSTAMQPISQELIESKIHLIRDQKVMFDSDIAKFYGVEAKRINEAVKRNPERFPQDFMFQITDEEWKEYKVANCDLTRNDVVANCDHIQNNKRRKGFRPYAFTEQGVMMLSSVLNSKKAIAVNIQIIRAFKKLTECVKTQTFSPDREMLYTVMSSIAQTVAMMQEQISAITELVATLAKTQSVQSQKKETVYMISEPVSQEKDFYSAAEAAKLLGKCNATISRWVLAGTLEGEIINTNSGPQYRIPCEAVIQFKLQNKK